MEPEPNLPLQDAILPSSPGQHNCFRGIAPFLSLTFLAVVSAIWVSAFVSVDNASSEDLQKLQQELNEVTEKLAQAISKLDEMEDCERFRGGRKDVPKHCAAKSENFLKTNNKFIRQLVKEELEIYDSDKTGLPDFALEALGGCIVSTRNTKPFDVSSAQLFVFGVPVITYNSNPPRALIQPSMQPGACWAFSGSEGTVVIQLIAPIFVSHVTLEHISAKLSPTGSIDSAPKAFSVWGLTRIEDDDGFYYGTFEYNKRGPTVQLFKIQHFSSTPYRLIEVRFLSNHGNQEFTCVYRVRIHGEIETKSST